MPVPPEVLFDRYFREPPVDFLYKGRDDLDRLESPEFRPLLLDLQEALNQALAAEDPVIDDRKGTSFHFDYIDSSVLNALAFRYEGYWFIGLTTRLIYSLWEVCVRLSGSDKLVSLLGIQIVPAGGDGLRVVLFRTAVYFVVMHEYAHHLHGHLVSSAAEGLPVNEVMDDGRIGELANQTFEADADAFAAHQGMTNLILGPARPLALSMVELDALPEAQQDELLFSCFAVAVCSFLLLRAVPALERNTVYRLTHPPPAVRIDGVIQSAIRWCRQNRSSLEGSMSPSRFEALINSVAEIFWEKNEDVRKRWAAQMMFLQSTDGLEYLRKLGASLVAHVSSL